MQKGKITCIWTTVVFLKINTFVSCEFAYLWKNWLGKISWWKGVEQKSRNSEHTNIGNNTKGKNIMWNKKAGNITITITGNRKIGKVRIQPSKNHCNFTWALWRNRTASTFFTVILSFLSVIVIRNFCNWGYFFCTSCLCCYSPLIGVQHLPREKWWNFLQSNFLIKHMNVYPK